MCLDNNNERLLGCLTAALGFFFVEMSFNCCFLIGTGEGGTDSGWLRCCIWTPGFQVQPLFNSTCTSFKASFLFTERLL